MPPAKSHIAPGSTAVTPVLFVNNGTRALEYYKAVFGAQVRSEMRSPDGKLMHGEILIGGALIFVSDEVPSMGSKSPTTLGGSPGSIYLYVADVDATIKKGVEQGGTLRNEPMDMFWGDRCGHITDPFGHNWAVTTHKEDVAPEEMMRRAKEFFSKTGGR